jgi:TELO2-interacting protein 1
MALRVLKKGLPLMAPHEDQLLPLVHKIWSPLVQRFSLDQNVVVLRLSFELLCVLASTSKSFIRHRCLEQVLPSICQFVEKQATVTQKQRHYLRF